MKEQKFKAIYEKRRINGLRIKVTFPNKPLAYLYFSTTESRDECMARARHNGATVEISY